MDRDDRIARGRRIAEAFNAKPEAVKAYIAAQPIPPRLLRALGHDQRTVPGTHPAGGPLTAAELRVLAAASMGWLMPKLATYTGLSRNTIRMQLEHAQIRLEAKNVTHAVAIAIRNGWLD